MTLQYATQLYRGAAAVSTATLYTVPASKTAVVTSVSVTNTSATAGTYTLTFAGTDFLKTVAIAANTTHVLDGVRAVLTPTQTITGSASAITVNFHVAGVVL